MKALGLPFLLIAIAASCATAASAAFDPVRDRDDVVMCLAAHMYVTELSVGLPNDERKALEAVVESRLSRLKPFFEEIEGGQLIGSEAAIRYALVWRKIDRRAPSKAMLAAQRRSEDCGMKVLNWAPPAPN